MVTPSREAGWLPLAGWLRSRRVAGLRAPPVLTIQPVVRVRPNPNPGTAWVTAGSPRLRGPPMVNTPHTIARAVYHISRAAGLSIGATMSLGRLCYTTPSGGTG